jgi:hypothetical protein
MDERRHDERQDVAGVAAGGVSAVSWAAVLAGAVVAVAVSLVLFALAAGINLAALSPELSPDRSGSLSGSSGSLESLTGWTAVALIVTQWISACAGGYITGRLRTRWVGTHTHEVFFRDTAHGFLTWCVATVFMASGLISVGAAAAHGSRTNVAARVPAAFADAPRGTLLLRLTPAGSLQAVAPDRAASLDRDSASERAARAPGELLLPETPADTRDSEATYLARLVPAPAARDASPEIADTGQGIAWQASDAERQDAATISIFTALSMLVGAFIASVSAALGGRLRDLHP